MRRLLVALLAVSSAFAFAPAAHADTISTFDLNLTLVDMFGDPAGTATGQVEIDTTNGFFTGADFTYTPLFSLGTSYTFTQEASDGINPNSNEFTIYFDSTVSDDVIIGFQLPVASLIGYTGGDVCSFFNHECNATKPSPANTQDLNNEGISIGSLSEVDIIIGIFDPFPDPGSGGSGNGDTAVTPEPSSLILLGTGLLGAVGAARRRFHA